MKGQCDNCNNPIVGREDKRFCNANCRARYHRNKKKQSHILTINNILLRNHTILSSLFEKKTAKEIKLNRISLSGLGFDFDYCTRVYLNSRGKWYKYIYNYRWMEFSDQRVTVYKE